MKTYARIVDGKVAELFQTADDITKMFHPDLVWTDVTGKAVEPGWDYADGIAKPPAPALLVTQNSIPPLQFIERFSEAEQLNIVTAAMSSPALRLWYDKLMAAQEVVFTDPRLSAGLDALVVAGLITVERKAELLR